MPGLLRMVEPVAYRPALEWAASRSDRFVMLLALDRRQDAARLAALRILGRRVRLTRARRLGWLAGLFFGPYRWEQREGAPEPRLVELLTKGVDPDEPCPVEQIELHRGSQRLYCCSDYARDQVVELAPAELLALEGALRAAGLDPERCIVAPPGARG